jgi:GT2 family glycosyltransferase
VTNNIPEIKVSAIVITCNSAEFITTSLEALQKEINSTGGEIIVFDNNSGDDTIAAIKSQFPEPVLIESERNIGFAAACNRASEIAKGEYLFFVNPDLVLDNGALKELIRAINDGPSAGAAVGRMRNPDGNFQPTCRNLPDIKNLIFSRRSVFGKRNKSFSAGDRYTLGDFNQITAVPAAAATCMLIKRDFFLKLGGFDRRFFLFMEDTDLSLRINLAGKKIYFVPGAGGTHHWGKGAKLSEWRRSGYHHISLWKYFLKHYPNGFSLFLLPILLSLNFILGSIMLLAKGKKDELG